MIANKHTELRLVSNLNDLLEDSKVKQEINKKIHKHTFDYMMTYVSDNDLEEVDFYDKLEELSRSYQKHCYNIAKEIKDEILGENGEEIEVYETIKGKQVEKKEIFLNPKKFSQEFKNNLEEDLTTLVIDSYFKELDNVIKVFEYNKKIDKLKRKDKKKQLEDNIEDIEFLVWSRIKKAYESYMENNDNDMQKVIDNFELVEWVREDILQDILSSINEYFENVLDIKKSDIESIFNKKMKAFIKEKQGVINAKQKEVYGEQVQINNTIKIPKTVKWYAISKIWEDITK